MGTAVYDKGFANWMEGMTGYELFTTFWDDFAIAERFGIYVKDGHYAVKNIDRGVSAIRDTFNRAFKEWKTNYKYLTELVMVLGWKASRFSAVGEEIDEYCELYRNLCNQADSWARKNLKGEELDYFKETVA